MTTAQRARALALALVVLGAVLVLATAGQSRWAADGSTSDSSAPGAAALALVALAGVGLLFLARSAGRTAVGVLLVLVGLAVVVVDARTGSAHSGAGSMLGLPAHPAAAHRSVWFWLTAAGGTLVAAGGLLTMVRARSWPGSRRSFEPSAARPDAWTALDRGEDPTL